MVTLALILAAPVAIVAAILAWCIFRAGDRETPRRLDALYREHEGDDAMTARERILARGTWPPGPDVQADAAEYYEGEGQDLGD